MESRKLTIIALIDWRILNWRVRSVCTYFNKKVFINMLLFGLSHLPLIKKVIRFYILNRVA
jgi:hypothetical protein